MGDSVSVLLGFFEKITNRHIEKQDNEQKDANINSKMMKKKCKNGVPSLVLTHNPDDGVAMAVMA